MYKSKKKLAVLCVAIFMALGMWMILSVHCRAAETNNDEKQSQTVGQNEATQQKIIRVGSFEDTFDYVDENGLRRGYGYELLYILLFSKTYQVLPGTDFSFTVSSLDSSFSSFVLFLLLV